MDAKCEKYCLWFVGTWCQLVAWRSFSWQHEDKQLSYYPSVCTTRYQVSNCFLDRLFSVSNNFWSQNFGLFGFSSYFHEKDHNWPYVSLYGYLPIKMINQVYELHFIAFSYFHEKDIIWIRVYTHIIGFIMPLLYLHGYWSKKKVSLCWGLTYFYFGIIWLTNNVWVP